MASDGDFGRHPILASVVVGLDEAVSAVAWSRLSHAYGNASDTPVHIHGLLAADAATRIAALHHIWNVVCHQDTISSATAPVVELIAHMLVDHRLSTPTNADDARSMRAGLLSYLGHVAAWSAYYQANPDTVAYIRRDDPELDAFDIVWEPPHEPDHVMVGRLGSGCARRAVLIRPLLLPWLNAADPDEREAALYATACWAGLVDNATPVPPQAIDHLRDVAMNHTRDLDVRVDCLLGLAGAGADTGALLDDAIAVIRICAALSPAVAGDARTLPAINATLANAAESNDWIRTRPPVPYAGEDLNARLVAAALACTDDFEQLLPAALGIAAVGKPWTIHDTWGLLLKAAFPQPDAERSALSDAQRAYLQALTANDAIWSQPRTDRDDLLRELGLPTDRRSLEDRATGQ